MNENKSNDKYTGTGPPAKCFHPHVDGGLSCISNNPEKRRYGCIDDTPCRDLEDYNKKDGRKPWQKHFD